MDKIEENAAVFRHKVPVQMRFSDVDLFGHVNNNVYFAYMDLGKTAYITDVLGAFFDPRKDAIVVASVNCDFCQPTLYDESIEVQTRVDSIGEHSFVFEQRVVNTDNGNVKCVCRAVMVGFNVQQGATVVIHDDWRSRISAYEGREF